MRKNVARSKKITDTQTLAANFNSDEYVITHLDNVGIMIVCGSVTDNTGEFKVEGYVKGPIFEELTVSPLVQLNDADQNFLLNLNQLPFEKIRITFTAAGGTPDGSCDIYVMSKEL